MTTSPSTRPQAASSVPVGGKPFLPVTLWAGIGTVILVFEIWVLAKWVTGPNFVPVPSGPSTPPGWMKLTLIVLQALSIPVLLGFVYRFLIRPWRRDRTVTTDGLLMIAFFFTFFQDPLSNYFGTWLTYNSWMWNYGSWVHDIPGWQSYGRPGAMVVEPPLFTPAAYIYCCLGLAILGCTVMRKAKARWPSLGPLRLVGICYLAMAVVVLVIEGCLFMPIGVWTYAGGHWAINSEHYYKFPLHEMIFLGMGFASFGVMRYFTNDRGQTFAERGVHRIPGGVAKRNLIRVLALSGAVQTLLFMLWTLPSALLVIHPGPYPRDMQERSYFTDYICGQGTDRACPGPAVPAPAPGSAYLDPSGRLVYPPGTTAPSMVPFRTGG